MNYIKIYDLIITKSKNKNRNKSSNIYYEKHHIIPKCMGGSNLLDNIVLLTAKEHFICHKLLTFIYPKNKHLALAFYMMVYGNKDKRNIKLSSKDFELARLNSSLASFGTNNPRYGCKLTNKHKEILSNRQINNKNCIGKKLSDETKLKISIANKGKLKGIPKSQEMREKLSKTNKGRKGPNLGKVLTKLRKPISAINKNGIIEYFDSAVQMSVKYSIKVCNINSCLKKRQNSTNGWTEFKYR